MATRTCNLGIPSLADLHLIPGQELCCLSCSKIRGALALFSNPYLEVLSIETHSGLWKHKEGFP